MLRTKQLHSTLKTIQWKQQQAALAIANNDSYINIESS